MKRENEGVQLKKSQYSERELGRMCDQYKKAQNVLL